MSSVALPQLATTGADYVTRGLGKSVNGVDDLVDHGRACSFSRFLNMTDSNLNPNSVDSRANPSHISSVCSLGLCKERTGPLHTNAGAYSDKGTVRETNDDLVFASNECRLYVVLDGVGGYQGGGEASLIVLEQLRANIEGMCGATFREANQDLTIAVSHAIRAATQSMLELSVAIPDFARMSTVFALAYVIDGVLLFAHVGDCRVYLVRRGVARQLTKDETFVQTMLDAGVIQPDDVKEHPMRNVILNSVSTHPGNQLPAVHSVPLLPDDRVVLSSDGITDRLSGEQLVAAMDQGRNPAESAKSLVDAALEHGSRDNASCVVVHIAKGKDAQNSCPRSELHYELSRLHELLCELPAVDDELRKEMNTVASDIRRALKHRKAKTLIPLGERLKERLLHFELSHPRLTAAVETITNALARFGI